MHIPTNWLAVTLAIATTASASRYYICEAPREHTWNGIQEPCKELGSNWCATDCNIFGANCAHCEYTTKGEPPKEDVAKLDEWCSGQPKFEYDAGDKHKSFSPKLEWYTYKNIDGCPLCGGCSYTDTCAFDAPNGQGLCFDY